MIEIKEKSKCCGCSACENVCPRNAIEMVEDEEGFKYPKINYDICTKCGLCKKVCPIINYSIEDQSIPIAYAAYNKDEKIRLQSSSGGIFTLIASQIINKNGIVFGAAFNDQFCVFHDKAETIEELEKFRSSKYMQSDLGKTFREVKSYLEKDRYILFTGTPCQIEGLKKYLQKDYSKLYTQDLICHGVPNKKVWKKYLDYRESIKKDTIRKISFRNKENKGWNKYQLKFDYDNGTEYIDHSVDLYMKIFLSDIALRESCYQCHFKKKHRISDITLADFWGINDVLPEMNDEKGTSLVLVNSFKGDELFSEIKQNIIYEKVSFEKAIKNNVSMTTSSPININRKDFLEELEYCNVEELVEKYIK